MDAVGVEQRTKHGIHQTAESRRVKARQDVRSGWIGKEKKADTKKEAGDWAGGEE